MHPHELDRLTDEEAAELQTKLDAWEDARNRKDYVLSDSIRKDLADCGVDVNYMCWMPTSESMESRQRRWNRRNEIKC